MRKVLVVLSAVATLAGCLPGRLSIPQSPLLKYVERKSGLIAATGTDGNLVTLDQGAANVRRLTADGVVPESTGTGTAPSGPFSYYQIPVWSPDDTRIAAVHYRGSAGQVEEVRIDLVPATSGSVRTVFTSRSRVPTIVSWSPDSRRLVFLATSESGASFGFYLVSAEGGEPLLLDAGVPYGWSWSPRGHELVIHAGSVSGGMASGRLAFLDVQEDVLEEGLGLPGGLFRSPDWSGDGRRVLVAAWNEEANRLFVTNRKRTEGAVLAEVEGELEFAFSPGDERVAYIVQDQDGSELYVVDVPTRLDARQAEGPAGATPQADEPAPAGRLLSGEDVVIAFFWSPDGTRIAYFTPHLVALGEGEDAGQALVLTLKIVETRRGGVREVSTFYPTSAFLAMIQNFAQYSHGLRIWSPDSRNVVYTAIDEQGPGVMVALAAESIAPRRIVPGLDAAWSRR